MRYLVVVTIIFAIGFPAYGQDLITVYNTSFEEKNYASALQIVTTLVASAPENMEFRREYAKMLAANGMDKDFLQEIVNLRESEHKESVITIFEVIKHDLVPDRLKSLAKSYFIAKNDRFVLAGWPKETWEKLQESGQIHVEKFASEPENDTEDDYRKSENFQSAIGNQQNDYQKISTLEQQEEISGSEFKKAKMDADATIKFCEYCLNSEITKTTNTITPSSHLLKYCQKHPKFSYLVYPEFIRVLKLGRECAIKEKISLSWVIFSTPANEILTANRISRFREDQKLDLLTFLLDSHVSHNYKFKNGGYTLTFDEINFLKEFPESTMAFLDSMEESGEPFKQKAQALKKLLNFYNLK